MGYSTISRMAGLQNSLEGGDAKAANAAEHVNELLYPGATLVGGFEKR